MQGVVSKPTYYVLVTASFETNNLSLCYAIKTCEGVEACIHTILTSDLVAGERLISCLGRFISGEIALAIHLVAGAVDPIAGTNIVEE
jgi:hypothetical protein